MIVSCNTRKGNHLLDASFQGKLHILRGWSPLRRMHGSFFDENHKHRGDGWSFNSKLIRTDTSQRLHCSTIPAFCHLPTFCQRKSNSFRQSEPQFSLAEAHLGPGTEQSKMLPKAWSVRNGWTCVAQCPNLLSPCEKNAFCGCWFSFGNPLLQNKPRRYPKQLRNSFESSGILCSEQADIRLSTPNACRGKRTTPEVRALSRSRGLAPPPPPRPHWRAGPALRRRGALRGWRGPPARPKTPF